MSRPRRCLSVVVPCFNERGTVEEVVARVLASPWVAEVVVVDDASNDGTGEVLAKLEDPRLRVRTHERNAGKGAALRTGFAEASAEYVIVQDADLEYDPSEYGTMLEPLEAGNADVVFGSRFLSGRPHRVLYFWHSIGNRLLTLASNMFTDLNLSDMETCYKAVRTPLLQSIPLRSNDFRIEPEITFKLEKRGARMYEVPISYSGRTYEEGKKIGLKDAWHAFWTMLHWWLVDDIYKDDEYGSKILVRMSSVPKFNRWMAEAVRPYLGAKVLEIGSGIGNMTRQLCPRDRYTATDINPHYLDYLQRGFEGRPYLDVRKLDLTQAADFAPLAGAYDTVVCLNVLEHLADEDGALANIRSALEPGGKALILVPQGPGLHGTLDEALGHVRRYTGASLRAALEKNGFELQQLFDFNRVTTPGWWWNGKVLRRRHFSRVQLKLLNLNVWWIKRLDPYLPWRGTSLIAVARKR